MLKFGLILAELGILYLAWSNCRLYTNEYHRNMHKPYNIRERYSREANKFSLVCAITLVAILLTLIYL